MANRNWRIELWALRAGADVVSVRYGGKDPLRVVFSVTGVTGVTGVHAVSCGGRHPKITCERTRSILYSCDFWASGLVLLFLRALSHRPQGDPGDFLLLLAMCFYFMYIINYVARKLEQD